MDVFSADVRLRPHARGVVAVLVVLVLGVSACGGSSITTRSAGAAEDVDCLTPKAVCLDQDFSGQDLSDKNLSGAILAGSRFDGANLRGTDFTGANLSGTSFAPAKCSVPFADMCLFDYQWNTLAPPVPVAVSSELKSFKAPAAVLVSPDSKTVFVADAGYHKVDRLDVATGEVTPLAGSGTPCPAPTNPSACVTGGPASKIKLSSPSGLALDASGRTLFVADAATHLLWQIDLSASDGTAKVIAGTGRAGTPAQGANKDPLSAPLSGPRGLSFDPDGKRLVFADTANNAVRALDIDAPDIVAPTIELIAGQSDGSVCKWLADSGCGSTDKAIDAILNRPTDVALAADGSVYIADSGNAAIRKVDTSGNISSILAPKSGTAKPTVPTFPEPTFVEFDRDQNLLVGPNNADDTGIGWLAKAKAVATDGNGKRHDWTEVATVLGGVSPAASAVAPNLRYLLAADPKGGILSVGVPQLGPNVKDAKFTSAEMSSDSGGGTATTLDGIFQAGADFTGVKLVGARIQNSMLDNFNNVDMRRATIGALSQLTANSICLSGATLTAKSYPAWNVTNASMLAMRVDAGADKKVRKSVFDGAILTNVNFALADADSKLEFSDGDLTGVNFSPAGTGKDNGQVIFNGTDLEPGMIPTGPDQDRPDYAAVPKKKWDPVKAAAACGGQEQEKTADTVESTTAVAAAPPYRWCETETNPACGVWSNTVELNLDANSHLSSGLFIQSTDGTGPFLADRSFQYEIRLDRNDTLIATGATPTVKDPTNAKIVSTSLDKQLKERDQALGVVRDGDTFSGEIRDGGRILSVFQGTFTQQKPPVSYISTADTELSAKQDIYELSRTDGDYSRTGKKVQATVEVTGVVKLVGHGGPDNFNLTSGVLVLTADISHEPLAPANYPHPGSVRFSVTSKYNGSVINVSKDEVNSINITDGHSRHVVDLLARDPYFDKPDPAPMVGSTFNVALSYYDDLSDSNNVSLGQSNADNATWIDEDAPSTTPVVPSSLVATAGLDTGWNKSRLDPRLVVDKAGYPLYLSADLESTVDGSGFFKQTNLSLRVTDLGSNTSFQQPLRSDAGAPNDFWDGRALRYNLARGKSLERGHKFKFELVTPDGTVQSDNTAAIDQPVASGPAPATGVVAKADLEGNFVVTWTNGQNAGSQIVGYTIMSSRNDGPFTPIPLADTCADLFRKGPNTSCALSGYLSSSKYAFKVVTFDGTGASGATSQPSESVQTAPSTPEYVWFDVDINVLNWTKPDDTGSPVTGYIVKRFRPINASEENLTALPIKQGTCADLSQMGPVLKCTVGDRQGHDFFEVQAVSPIGTSTPTRSVDYGSD